MKTFPYTVKAPANPQGTFTITVNIKVDAEGGATSSDIINYIRSLALKQDLSSSWMREKAPNCGLEVHGGPRPIMKDQADRSSDILAYEQDFRLCPRI